MSKAREARNRRWSTLVWGSIPVVLLAGALTADHIPGTDIRLTVPYAAEGPGPMFNTLHLMFEGQYTELALAVDAIAERIRALGFPAPGTYAAYARLSSIKEEEGVPTAEEMIKQLVQGQEAVVRTARDIFPLLDKVSDEPTADLLTQRMQVHEKTAWMLRSLLAA